MIKAIEERGRRWRISFTTSSLSGIQAAVADGGISVLPARVVTDEHVVLTAKQGFAPIEHMDIAILHRPTADPMVSELTKALATMLELEE